MKFNWKIPILIVIICIFIVNGERKKTVNLEGDYFIEPREEIKPKPTKPSVYETIYDVPST